MFLFRGAFCWALGFIMSFSRGPELRVLGLPAGSVGFRIASLRFYDLPELGI